MGRRDWAQISSRSAALGLDPDLYRPVQYEERMPTLYAAADVVVCRAGATSVAELAVVGLPAVLVPLPGAPGDHQTANARSLSQAGAAVSLPDGDCTAVRLAGELDGLLADRDRMTEMGRRARQVGRPRAAEQVAELVEEHARQARRDRRPHPGDPLDIGLKGRYEGAPFTLTGRTQYRHPAGGVWDEWYAAFDDGRVVELHDGELFHIPPIPHDSWVIGDEPYVSLHFLGAEHYAAKEVGSRK